MTGRSVTDGSHASSEAPTPRTPGVPRHEHIDVASGVARTSLLVAAGRAVDTHRTDGLIDDPFAEAFVLAAELDPPLATRPTAPADDSEDEAWQMMSGYVGVRTRFFDEFLTRAVDDGHRQVVLLASGMDARAHRLNWPAGTTVFDLDRPAVLGFKRGVLAAQGAEPRCRLRFVGTDLAGDWTTDLLAAGFDPRKPTAWLAEGLLPYLSGHVRQRLQTEVTALSASGSRWGIEHFDVVTAGFTDPTFRRLAERYGLEFLSETLGVGAQISPIPWLARNGWDVVTQVAREVSAQYGRTLDPVTDRLNGPVTLITADLLG